MMKPEKVAQVLRNYQTYLADAGVSVKQFDGEDYDARAVGMDEYHPLAHCRWMAQVAIDQFVDDPDHVDKAHRWLGFIQGVLFTLGKFTLNDLKRHSGFPEGYVEPSE